MKDLEKNKIELRSRFKRTIVVGIIVLVMVILSLPSRAFELMVSLTILTWIIIYIDYCLLKLKIEIMEELSKGNETNKSK